MRDGTAMNRQAIRDSMICASTMAGREGTGSVEGYLPQISPTVVDFHLRSTVHDAEGAGPRQQRATAVPCHRVAWQEFQASERDFASLSMAWKAVGSAVGDEDMPWPGDSLTHGGQRATDLTSRALSVLQSHGPHGDMLLVDSGPLAFRWAMLAIGAESFETVIVSAMGRSAESWSPFLPAAEDPDSASPTTFAPEQLLAVTPGIEAARINRHLSGVPSVTLETVLSLARLRDSNPPLLTIVIPALGYEGLDRSLDSIVRQDTRCGVEVLIMKASQRGEVEMPVERRETASTGLRVVEIPVADGGPYEAMNAGLTLASSPWVYFMGCGDTFAHKEVLAALRSELDAAAESCGMIYGNVRMQGAGPGAEDGEIYAGEFTYDRLREQNICHQAIVYRLSALRRLGGFDSRYPVNADWAVNLKGWQLLEPRYTDLVVADFVRGGLSTTAWDSRFFDDLEALWTENRPGPGAIGTRAASC